MGQTFMLLTSLDQIFRYLPPINLIVLMLCVKLHYVLGRSVVHAEADYEIQSRQELLLVMLLLFQLFYPLNRVRLNGRISQ
jgi:hypothetical protein